MSKAEAIIKGVIDQLPLTEEDYAKIALFHENADKLNEAVKEGDIPIVELDDKKTRQIVNKFTAIVDERFDTIQTQFQQLVMDNQDFLRKLMEQSQRVNPDALPPVAPPAALLAAPPASMTVLDNEVKKGKEIQQQKLISKKTPPKAVVSDDGKKFEVVQAQSFRLIQESNELLQNIANAVDVENEQQAIVPDTVVQNLDTTRKVERIVRNTDEAMNELSGQVKVLFAEIFAIRRDINQASAAQLKQGQDIQEGVKEVKQDIQDVGKKVGDVNLNVSGMRGEVSVRFDQAEAQVKEFRDFAAQRFNDVIGEIHRIGTYDSPCELKYNQGYGKFFNSLVWCIFVFLRFLFTIYQCIKELYFQFTKRLLAILPENIAGVPLRWLFEMAFVIMEWGAFVLILDKFIGPLIGRSDLATEFIINSGVFMVTVIKYVFTLIYLLWNTLTSSIKKAIVEIGNQIGLWDFINNIWKDIYDFITKTISDAISKAASAAYKNIPIIPSMPSVPNLNFGLYDMLGLNPTNTAAQTGQLGGNGINYQSYGGADIPPDLKKWLESAQENKYLEIINISLLLNQAVFYNVIKYINNIVEFGIADPTFISFLSTNSNNILTFQKNANHLYYVFKNNGIFEMRPSIKENPRVQILSTGRRKTHRRYKNKQNPSRNKKSYSNNYYNSSRKVGNQKKIKSKRTRSMN
jgi:hypothetical protein